MRKLDTFPTVSCRNVSEIVQETFELGHTVFSFSNSRRNTRKCRGNCWEFLGNATLLKSLQLWLRVDYYEMLHFTSRLIRNDEGIRNEVDYQFLRGSSLHHKMPASVYSRPLFCDVTIDIPHRNRHSYFFLTSSDTTSLQSTESSSSHNRDLYDN